MSFRRGDRVHQVVYGAGDVVDANAYYITIDFDDGTTRKFVAARVHLKSSSAPRPDRLAPPPRAKRGRAKRVVELPPSGTRS